MYKPLLFRGKEDIWVLRVELEGLPDVRPTQGAGRERQFPATGTEEPDEGMDEEDEENGSKTAKLEHGCEFHDYVFVLLGELYIEVLLERSSGGGSSKMENK